MVGTESKVETSAQNEIADLLGKEVELQLPIRLEDLEALPEEERDAEVSSKEQSARFNERAIKQTLKQLKEEHNLRTKFTPRIFWLVVGMLIGTFVLFLCSGILNACGRMFLSDKVLMTLLGSTVADVIGLLIFALNWLYPKIPKQSPLESRMQGDSTRVRRVAAANADIMV